MIELDGIEYQVQTPDENTTAMVQYINTYCADNNIVNTQGDVIRIEPNRANPLYMVLFGLGYLVSIIQKLVYNVGCAFNIQASSPRQLLNLADIANIRRRGSSKTTIPCVIFASEDGPCEIATTLSATVSVGGTTVTFHPAFNTTIEPNHAVHVPLVADEPGSYSISENTVTAFSEPVTNLDHMVTLASIPGSEQESIASLRNRMQNRVQTLTQVERAADAIRQLDGVTSCSIFYNYSSDIPRDIDNINVPPRRALVVVQGYSPYIAQTYYCYLMCESAQGPDLRNIVQNYTTKAGQVIPVNIVTPRTVPLHIRVFVNDVLSDSVILQIKDAISTIASSLEIAQPVTSVMIMEAVRNVAPDVNILGADLGTNTVDYAYIVKPEPDQLLIFNLDYITIEEVNS